MIWFLGASKRDGNEILDTVLITWDRQIHAYMIFWLIGWLFGWMIIQLVDLLNDWLIDWLIDCMVFYGWKASDLKYVLFICFEKLSNLMSRKFHLLYLDMKCFILNKCLRVRLNLGIHLTLKYMYAVRILNTFFRIDL